MEKIILPENYMIRGAPMAEPPTPEISEPERLLMEFESHDVNEEEFIRAYREMAEKSNDALIKFLLQLIITDEERHHEVMHAMASSLRGSISWTQSQDALPALGELGEEKGELLKLTADFIKLEKEGIKESKKLLKSTKGYYQGLFGLLVTTTIHDSEKHVEILDFLHRRLKKA